MDIIARLNFELMQKLHCKLGLSGKKLRDVRKKASKLFSDWAEAVPTCFYRVQKKEKISPQSKKTKKACMSEDLQIYLYILEIQHNLRICHLIGLSVIISMFDVREVKWYGYNF